LISLVLEHSRRKQQLNFVPLNSLFLSPEDFRDAFCVAGGVFGRPCYLNKKLCARVAMAVFLQFWPNRDQIPTTWSV